MTDAFHDGDIDGIMRTYEPGAVVIGEPGAPVSGETALPGPFPWQSALPDDRFHQPACRSVG